MVSLKKAGKVILLSDENYVHVFSLPLAPNRRQRSMQSDTMVSPSANGVRAVLSSHIQGHSRTQYQPQHQVPYVPHQSHYQGGTSFDDGLISKYSHGSKGHPH